MEKRSCWIKPLTVQYFIALITHLRARLLWHEFLLLLRGAGPPNEAEMLAEGADGSVGLKWSQTQGPTHWLHFYSSSASLQCPHQALGQFFIPYLFLCICPHLFSYGPVGNETFPCLAFLSFLKIFYLFNFGGVGSTLLCGLCSRCNEQGLLSSCGAAFSLLWLPVAESRL